MNENILCEIRTIALKYKEVLKVVLFGSRARGDCTDKSDYDIAVFAPGISSEERAKLSDEIGNIKTLLKIDLVFIKNENNALNENIRKDGIIIMDKFKTKLENFERALGRLSEAVSEYTETKSLVARDGVIQRFEFTAELAWKSTREYLLTLGVININSPKPVMKEAFNNNLISDETAWLQILDDRNITAHIYDEEEADAVYDRISKNHIPAFNALLECLKNV